MDREDGVLGLWFPRVYCLCLYLLCTCAKLFLRLIEVFRFTYFVAEEGGTAIDCILQGSRNDQPGFGQHSTSRDQRGFRRKRIPLKIFMNNASSNSMH